MKRIPARWPASAVAIALQLAVAGCGSGMDSSSPSAEVGSRSDAVVGPVYGSVPAGLPARMLVGLVEVKGDTWMQSSGVPWDVRYAYFTKGWVNNWGWSAADGSWGLSYMRECDSQGFIPAISYYQIFGEPGGGESATYTKTQNATTMTGYFNDFKILMQRARDFGRPVIILLEPDAFGFLQQQSTSNPNAYAAVAATGIPELATLPNTVAGWGLAFLQLRKSVGATNAILGVHISAWASSKDISYVSVTDPLQPEVDSVYNFLKPFGLATNVTGATFDVLVGDPLDRDSDYYRLTQNQDRWWDASDTASISSKSFNRYAEWMRLWNVTSGKRWIVWQIPLGNSNHLNVNNNGNPREGYKDNRPEYFFASTSTAHLQKFASSGAIALLFGAGMGGMSSYTNDLYTDGQLFMKNHAGAFLSAGGLAIPATSGSTGGGADAGTPPPPPQDAGTPPASTDAGTPPSTGAPVLAATATVSPQTVAAGATSTITAKVSNTGGALAGGVVDIEVYDSSGKQVAQRFFENVSVSGGASQSFSYAWTAAAVTGSYVVKLGVFGAGWAPLYTWNNGAATVTVTGTAPSSGDAAQYGFESGTQGWIASGAAVTGVSSTTAKAYAGTHSLAVSIRGAGNGVGSALVAGPSVPAGKTVSFRVWVPSRSKISFVRPFVLQPNGTKTSVSRSVYVLSQAAWNTIKVTVPSTATSLSQLGVDFGTNGTWTGTAYVDSVAW